MALPDTCRPGRAPASAAGRIMLTMLLLHATSALKWGHASQASRCKSGAVLKSAAELERLLGRALRPKEPGPVPKKAKRKRR